MLRVPIYPLSSLICHTASASVPFVSTSFQVVIEECLRLSSIILACLSIQDNHNLRPDESAFSHVWALALGWAAAEVVVSVYQGYGQLFLYSDIPSFNGPAWPHPHRFSHLANEGLFYDPEDISIEEIDMLLRIRECTELEALYGIPVTVRNTLFHCTSSLLTPRTYLYLFLVCSASILSHYPWRSFSSSHPHIFQTFFSLS